MNICPVPQESKQVQEFTKALSRDPEPRDESYTTEYAVGDALPIVFHGAARPVLTAT